MFSRITRNELIRMMNAVFFTPMLYALVAWVLSRHPLHVDSDLNMLTVICLAVSIGLIILARPLRWLLLPPGKHPSGKIVVACFVLSTIGEIIAMCGVAVVWLGARLESYIPFLIVSGLYYLDFRVFRFPAIMALWPDEK
jgi:hypothetical protein